MENNSQKPSIGSTGQQSAGEPILTFEGKQYNINTLPKEVKELLKGLQAADYQLKFQEDLLRTLAVGRQTLVRQLNQKLKEVEPNK